MTNAIIDDPRIDPRLKVMFGAWTPTQLPDLESRDQLLALLAAAGDAALPIDGPVPDESLYEAVASSTGLVITTEQIRSVPDGNTISLQIIRPEGEGPFPCVYYIHGGGMMMSSCFDPNYRAWGRLIAGFGVAVVMVDFRNALYPSSAPETAPYPAGLNDCVAGLRWVHANADRLKIDRSCVIIEGESGGANLALATAMTLKREGDLALIKGVYVQCPYLAGEWTGRDGSSALRNAGILMDTRSNYGAVVYGIDALKNRNPLAWPGMATQADVEGFPPVVIAVNECDPLRDDGVDFYRLLLQAGVRARCHEVMGTVHGTEIYILPCPEISRAAARDIAAFCAE